MSMIAAQAATASEIIAGGFLPAKRFYSPAFAALEAERLWPSVWQLACRERELPSSGDWTTFDILGQSVVVVRQPDGALRAFHNACPHRGNRLVDGSGNARHLVCTYHCWSFELDGQLHAIPEREDFPPLDEACYGLCEVRVETWGGFVFVHLDPEAQPLQAWLAGLSEELSVYAFEEMACFMRRRISLPFNWKTCLDAFQEVYHVRGVHPQLLPGLKTAASTFHYWGPHSMMCNPNGEPAARGSGSADDRSLMLEFRRGKADAGGLDVSQLAESRLIDNYQYHLFPNVSFNTHATGCQLFRFLPDPRDVESMLLDIWFLERDNAGVERAAEAKSHTLDGECTSFGQSLAGFTLPPGARSFGQDLVDIYAAALDQDFEQLRPVQRGLHSAGLPPLALSSQEQRIAHWNATLDKCLAGPGLDEAMRFRRVAREPSDGDGGC